MKNVTGFLSFLLIMITITSCAQKRKQAVEPHLTAKQLSKYSQATFAAGCFWHEEAMFESIKGVKEAISGYAGGKTNNPSYESLETGTTGHAETVNVYYDSSIITYPALLKIYFSGQDPTQVNGQGNDRGTQYRSIAFYRNNQEKQLAQDYIKNLQASGKYDKPVAVQLMPFTKFWQAEDYHQNYIDHNPGSGYVQVVSIPEIKKLQKEYPELIKPDHIY
ncbi:MAG: Peptide-methionine (S)-S-oxide reductase MsrA [uncultured Segetibacter sp.]|uniref:Peptide methionine sulfoxide reductase MsrA n=1 Tax=uncultured Segetibacter sp. TaxID=481133 RepID=A0A6J4RSN4_9BACT|nr:MAG: Peptide-methionine (S)-S-oxide reductase MsrA [uncultured Segetibacter sp.]